MNAASRPRQFATFYVGDLLFGIDVRLVQEIIRYQKMTSVPLAAPEIRGLINLRGQIITAIDMRRCLKMEDADDASFRPMNVVVTLSDETVSLLVDGIGDVVETESIPCEGTPHTFDPLLRRMVTSVFKLENGLLLSLDPEKTVDIQTIH